MNTFSDKLTLPDFLCIGSQRAGTTWLHECLREHPDLFLPEQKELHFFNSSFDKGLEYYSSMFKGGVYGEQKFGEISPNY